MVEGGGGGGGKGGAWAEGEEAGSGGGRRGEKGVKVWGRGGTRRRGRVREGGDPRARPGLFLRVRWAGVVPLRLGSPQTGACRASQGDTGWAGRGVLPGGSPLPDSSSRAHPQDEGPAGRRGTCSEPGSMPP